MSSILKTYLENETAIKRFLRRYFARSEDIDDIAQETFIRAYAAEAIETVRFPKAFLFKIARNLALNERAKLSNATTDALEDFLDRPVIEDVSQVAVDDRMEAQQQVRVLAQAIASLPPQCSRVFLLRKVHGLSYKQIASHLNISVSTAEKHAALGLVRCSEYMRQQGYEIYSRGEAGNLTRGQSAKAAASRQVANFEVRRRDRTRDE